MTEASKKRIDNINFDEQKLLEMSIDHNSEHQYAADYRIGFRYGFNRGKVAGYEAAIQDPDANKELLDKAIEYVEELMYPEAKTRDMGTYNKAIQDAVNRLKKIREARK